MDDPDDSEVPDLVNVGEAITASADITETSIKKVPITIITGREG